MSWVQRKSIIIACNRYEYKLLSIVMTSGYASRDEPATAAKPVADTSACGLLFVRLAHVSRARLTEALEGMGLRPADFAILHHLAEAGPLPSCSSPARSASIPPTSWRCSTGSRLTASWCERATPLIAAATWSG